MCAPVSRSSWIFVAASATARRPCPTWWATICRKTPSCSCRLSRRSSSTAAPVSCNSSCAPFTCPCARRRCTFRSGRADRCARRFALAASRCCKNSDSPGLRPSTVQSSRPRTIRITCAWMGREKRASRSRPWLRPDAAKFLRFCPAPRTRAAAAAAAGTWRRQPPVRAIVTGTPIASCTSTERADAPSCARPMSPSVARKKISPACGWPCGPLSASAPPCSPAPRFSSMHHDSATRRGPSSSWPSATTSTGEKK